MADSEIAAIFDFDGTLTTGHLWRGAALYFKEHKVRRIAVYRYFLANMPLWLASKMNIYSAEKNRIAWGTSLAGLFKGYTTEEVTKIFKWISDNYFQDLMRSDVSALMQRHREQGHTVILLSGMFNEFLEEVGGKIGVHYVVGTHLEVTNGLCTGKIISPLCFGKNKAVRLKELIIRKKLLLDLKRSYAYADSIYDLPVLEMVGHAVATYPDKELVKEAEKRRWQVVSSDIQKDNNLKSGPDKQNRVKK
jgi:HAD superfamily hydrolase (TIGR01490 family)